MSKSVVQDWVSELSFMQQTVLIELARGPDGLTKYHPSKYLLRWARRCFLYSAMESKKRGVSYVIPTPYDAGGGSFTGPSYDPDPILDDGNWEGPMDDIVSEYIRGADELPHHWYRHFMHGVEIMGYKHPDERIRRWWYKVYHRLCRDLHLNPETEGQMDFRLGDSREDWIAAGDPATLA